MAALVEGNNYGLATLSATSAGRTAVHVKLTDSASKAIEEFQKIKGATTRRPVIQFKGNQGVVKVPIEKSSENPEGLRTFQFSLSSNPGDPKGSFDCIQQGDAQSSDASRLEMVGSMLQRISIQANEDSYANTKMRMEQAEEESKKSCAKEIKPSGRNISRKIKKVVKSAIIIPTVKPLQLKPCDPGNLSNQRSGLDCNHSSALAKPVENSITKPVSSSLSLSAQQPAKSSIMHNKNNPSVGQGTKGHSISSPSPANYRASSPIVNMPLRERIIHLLAVRPYKKPELLIRLNRDGIRSRDKNTITSHLKEVATYQRDNSYTLAKHMYSHVRSDWPFFTETDRVLLKRRMPDTLSSAGSSPALSVSPCHSNSSQGSPTSSQKRPGSSEELFPQKRQRVAHQDVMEYHKNRSSLVRNQESKALRESPENQVPSPTRSNDKSSNSVDLSSSSFQVPDYVRQYTKIKDRSQRRQYKSDFNSEYEEYRSLHAKVEHVVRRFLQMEQVLKHFKEGSSDYESTKNQIVSQYKELKKNYEFQEQKKRCDYLHCKLGHIKQLIISYDKQHSSAS